MSLLYQFFFYLFGLIAVASAIVFVTRRHPVAAVLWLVMVMVALAALYVMLGAHFVGAVQVLIYAGAIMVVFLFVVMLLNLGHEEVTAELRRNWWRLGAGLTGLVLLAQLLTALRLPLPRLPAEAIPSNVVAPVAEAFFRRHLVAFEVSSVLLLAAIVGAVLLAKKGGIRE